MNEASVTYETITSDLYIIGPLEEEERKSSGLLIKSYDNYHLLSTYHVLGIMLSKPFHIEHHI